MKKPRRFIDVDQVFSIKLSSIIQFLEKLEKTNSEIWSDEIGAVKISITEHLSIDKLLNQYGTYVSIISPLLKKISNTITNIGSDDLNNCRYVFSIGAHAEHNLAKERLFPIPIKKRPYLITIPVPLSNDSFFTNRSSPHLADIRSASRETIYPSETIVALNILSQLDRKLNAHGIGEWVGLYYSLRDWSTINEVSLSACFIRTIVNNTIDLWNSYHKNEKLWLKRLAINLLLKCLVMRIAGTNDIGSGGDHLLAYALQDKIETNKALKQRLSHGEYVYLGAILMAALFPEWEYDCYSLNSILQLGIETGILRIKVFNYAINMLSDEMIEHALRTRAKRLTMLSRLSHAQIKNARIKLSTILRTNLYAK